MTTKSIIEKMAESLRLIKPLPEAGSMRTPSKGLNMYPPFSQWKDWEENDPNAWPRRTKKRYHLIPTTCFNCESACGLLAYVDKKTGKVRKLEGNPHHPGSRGGNCAKGPATINQIYDPERILYPLKRKGPRGGGEWERISWDQALNEIAEKIGTALREKRRNEIVYHVGRQGHEGYMDRVLNAWGVDGHNSHTNICSSGARFGFAIWQGYDRPSPDFENSSFILLLSSHLETGHYFNPHAQRIIESMLNGAELAVMDPRLSNTASMANHWMATYPGTEAAVLLAMVRVILMDGTYNREFMETFVNWKEYLAARHPRDPQTFETFIEKLIEIYAEFTPEFAAREAGIEAEQVLRVARKIGLAGTRFCIHNWRGPSAGSLGGWQVARALHFLTVVTGAIGTPGGTSPSAWNKFKPTFFDRPPAHSEWNELHFPPEYPLSHYEPSQILPHLLREGRGRMEVYFTRVFNPVWTYPDGFAWIEMLRNESMVGTHVALTPTWNETAFFADYVLPMGLATERHDLNSYETHSGVWIAFRQPVLRRFAEEQGRKVEFTHEVNPGEVWEEDEFWIELSWRMDPDGSLGVQEHFMSPYRSGEKVNIQEYYRYIFENVPGLPDAAAREGLDAYQYMARHGAFEVERDSYHKHNTQLPEEALKGTKTDDKSGLITRDGEPVGLMADGVPVAGFPTPSRRQEFWSQTMVEWGWPEYELPGYIRSHVHPENLDSTRNEFALVPNFRLPTHIHSRSANSKWLAEIAHRNPIWIHTSDAARLGVQTGDMLKISTDIGYFVDRVWVSEAIKPGVVGCSHHIGRWKLENGPHGNSWMAGTVRIEEGPQGQWRLIPLKGVERFKSTDPDTSRIFWRDAGVHQNITHAVHPDPISGMHAWHQRVRLELPGPENYYGEIFVDSKKSQEVFREWLDMTRPPKRKDGLRRPLWFHRPLRPQKEAFFKKR
ncbi:MAG: molybdopterin-dependent oxidoreductase [Deltaproteobacteria bacterium]|nr:molybdopterin-dependent oxidoreductase [Deltaproteobacteria bacterium]